MYRTYITLQAGAFDVANSRIFIPEIASCNFHSIQFDVVGAPAQFEMIDFEVEPPFLIVDHSLSALLDIHDKFIARIDYHDLRPAENFGSLSKSIVSSTLTNAPSAAENNAIEKRAEIFAKHFAHAQFSLDLGLYKEAVLNYGTVLETLLNLDLRHANLGDLISCSNFDAPSKVLMNDIRHLRNRVHPERLDNFGDVTRAEAIKSRQSINLIINKTGVISNL